MTERAPANDDGVKWAPEVAAAALRRGIPPGMVSARMLLEDGADELRTLALVMVNSGDDNSEVD